MNEDPAWARYDALRASLASDPQRDLKLARAARKLGLQEPEALHWNRILLDSSNSLATQREAVRRLGLRAVGEQWLTSEQVADAERQDRELELARKQWKPRLQRWLKLVEGRSSEQRQRVVEELKAINDVDVIPVLEEVFSNHSAQAAEATVTVLASWPQVEATESLLGHALQLPWEPVRQLAMDHLADRPFHDFVPELLDELWAPVQSRFWITVDRGGVVRHQHQLARAGAEEDRVLVRNHAEGLREVPVVAAARTDATARQQQARQIAEESAETAAVAELLAMEARLRAQQIEQQVARQNLEIAQHNAPLLEVLGRTTQVDLPARPESWWEWWRDYNDQYLGPRRTLTQYVNTSQSYAVPRTMIPQPRTRCECFVAGTPVRTVRGPVPIESIRIGDRVLSQDPETGEIAFKLVAATTLRPTTAMLEISAGDTHVRSTLGHPFWVEGHGWRMAKSLKVGDSLHGLNGPVQVTAVQPAPDAEAYNLVVVDFNTYFVSDAAILAHDNADREPSLALTPGLLKK